MKLQAVLVATLAFAPFVCWAQDKPKDDGKKEAPKRVDLLRFYDKKLHEHVYTYGEGEPAAWRQHPDMEGETVIGQVAITREPDTTRLFRAIRPDRKHYFYLQRPAVAQDIRLEEFVVYVWTKPGDGRVPVHACILPDATDVYLDTDPKKVSEFADDTFKGTGVKRKSIAKIFYVNPPSKAEERKDKKKKEDKKPFQ